MLLYQKLIHFFNFQFFMNMRCNVSICWCLVILGVALLIGQRIYYSHVENTHVPCIKESVHDMVMFVTENFKHPDITIAYIKQLCPEEKRIAALIVMDILNDIME